MLIEDIEEELDPVLDNVLEKNFIKSGSAFKVSNPPKVVEWVVSLVTNVILGLLQMCAESDKLFIQ